MRVFLTGHRGYIGTRLVPKLISAGHEVAGADIGWFDGNHLPPSAGLVAEHRIDVRDLTIQHLEGFDAIIHLAGVSNDPVGDLNAEATLDINFRASLQTAKLAKMANVKRFLYASSCSLYGASGDVRELLDESARFHPVTPYGESKVLAEKSIVRLADQQFSPTFLRCATVYGDSPMLRADLVVNNLVAHAWYEKKVLMKSDGTPWRPLVHVDDVCSAYLAILHAPKNLVAGQAFNVGRTEENYQVRQVAEWVERIVPNCEICFANGASADKRCYRVDCRKIEKRLPEFQPAWTVAKGVRQLASAYQSRGWSLEQLLGPEFMRIERIQQLLANGRIDPMLRMRRTKSDKLSRSP